MSFLLQISKQAIDGQKKYKPADDDEYFSIGYVPRIEIEIKKVPKSQDSEPLELKVEGLNKESAFQISPGSQPHNS